MTLNAHAVVRSAMTLFDRRMCSKLKFRNIVRIHDSLEIVVRYLDALSTFIGGTDHVGGLVNWRHGACPFQFECCFVFDRCHGNSIRDDEKDDVKDHIGEIEPRLQGNGLRYKKKTLTPDYEIEDQLQTEYMSFLDFRKPFNEIVRPEADIHYTHHKRFGIVVDRRQNKGRSPVREKRNDWRVQEDQLWLFEYPLSCSRIPQKALPEWYFDSSKVCLLPGTGKAETVRSTSHCDGSLLTLSIHALENDVVKCYLYWNGQKIRFVPRDIRSILPTIFNMKWNAGQELEEDGTSQNEACLREEAVEHGPRSVDDIIHDMEQRLADRHFNKDVHRHVI